MKSILTSALGSTRRPRLFTALKEAAALILEYLDYRIADNCEQREVCADIQHTLRAQNISTYAKELQLDPNYIHTHALIKRSWLKLTTFITAEEGSNNSLNWCPWLPKLELIWAKISSI